MRLKTRILLYASAAIAAAVLLCCMLILRLVRVQMQSDAAEKAYSSFAEISINVMSRVIYEAQTENHVKPYYIDLEVTRVELSAIRIREKNAEGCTGLYVPAWIFYGKLTDNYDNPVTQEMIHRRRADTALLVVNAIDGSIIDLGHGY